VPIIVNKNDENVGTRCTEHTLICIIIRIVDIEHPVVFCATILSRILYALPAWEGFLTVELTNKIDIFLRKAVKWG